ncbi:helix-turn-helix domain-containing protein [Companilactobacillus halodurans]|uniref:Helix-turn-helix transcriptional regulator n=1 Tax=Companilactobacillus halodurans TaxID=2584183 RepID=A0A5P0ZUB0_9LACO|nr:helix-turn-helix transcriptional regulator [Companilactobacillus halodurans]MQS75977.1 helix-turn-helix transcriptional regulator [Companilactobacillus halodurans]MQS96412.1 helix-turn-helix transcriptional regulator [Companilactobacillus halodurans]
MKNNISFDSELKKDLKNPEFKKEFDKYNDQMNSAVALLTAREELGWTQSELAQKAHMPQSTIARIETGHNISVDKLSILASVMGKKLKISIS